jgi:hypothetical protein
MKRLLLFAALLTLGSIPACQCSDKPPVSPTEDEDESSVMPSPHDDADIHAVRLV